MNDYMEEEPHYLLDSNIVSEIIKHNPDFNVISKIAEHNSDCAICAPSLHELLYGFEKIADGNNKTYLEKYINTDVLENFKVKSYTEKPAAYMQRFVVMPKKSENLRPSLTA